MTPSYTILTEGSDPAESLQIIGTIPSTQVVFQGSINELKDRIASYPVQIQTLQNNQVQDQALLDSLTALFTSSGVSDTTVPLTIDQTTAIKKQNATAMQTIIQAQITTLTTQQSTQPITP